jgi:hypothetical protein
MVALHVEGRLLCSCFVLVSIRRPHSIPPFTEWSLLIFGVALFEAGVDAGLSEQDATACVSDPSRFTFGLHLSDLAARDIEDLVERNILRKDAAGGRSTSYSLAGGN